MVYMKSLVAGIVAGLIGAGVWAAIAYFAGYEVGWIAWGVGGLVGIAVRFFSEPEVVPTGDAADDALNELRAEADQLGPGVIAAVVAIAAVLLGKFAAVWLLVGNLSGAAFEDEELLISYIADEVVEEYTAAGRAVSWPPGSRPEQAAAQADYPSDVWSDAVERWNAMSPEDQDAFKEATAAMYQALLTQGAAGSFLLSSFSMFDLLWFGLAGWTAFKLGASGSEE